MRNTLVPQNNNTGVNVKTIPTYELCEMMDRTHAKVIRMLEGDKSHIGIIPTITKAQLGVSNYFIESTYKDASGKINKYYECTKMGCDMLANKMTGEKGILFTAKYVKRFKEMEQQIEQQVLSVEQITQIATAAAQAVIAPIMDRFEKLIATKEAPKTRTPKTRADKFSTLPTVRNIAKPFGITGAEANKILEKHGIIRRSDNGKGSILNEEYEDRWGTTIYEDGKEPYVRYFDLGVNSITKIFSRITNASEQEQLNLF